MKNKKKISGRILCGLALILLMAGCVDIIKAPPAAPDPTDLGDGQVVITIGSGLERTVFPRMDQFSKILLSFERKDGAGSKEDEEVNLGETLINLTPGTWEIAAAAYNKADTPAVVARAVNTLTRDGDQITGDTYFALAPVGTGPGILRYRVAPPGGIALDAAQSRIWIEQDDAVLSSLNSDSFTAGVRPISGAVNGSLNLNPGRYAVDIVLDDNGSVNTAVYRAVIAILPGLVTEIVFSPVAGDFLDPDVRMALTGAVTFGRTTWNTSGTIVGSVVGEGANRTRGLSVPKRTGTVYFTLSKAASQTITLDAAAAGKVVWTESGTVDASIASATRPVFTVDTGDLAEAGGDRVFALSLAEPGKTPLTYTVTITVPHLTKIVIDKFPESLLYMQGISFDTTGMELTGTWSDLTTARLLPSEVGINGFDATQIGAQYLRVVKNGVASDNGFTVTIVERGESELFFECGWGGDQEPGPNRFTVVQGRSLVLAPVQWLIPDNAVYEWKLNDVTQSSTTEYLSVSPASTGEYAITVTAKVDGSPIASASTTVVCVTAPVQRPITGASNAASSKVYARVAPGQFGEYETGSLYGAGGFGGYTVFKFDHSVARKGVDGEELLVGGNAFSGWNEPGIIWVMQDENGNGSADDTWYELKGSHDSVATRRYSVKYPPGAGFWIDNQGVGETPARKSRYTYYTGTRLPNEIARSLSVIWGYADVVDNGRVSLSNAVQMDGSSIALDFIDFVKVQTAINDDEPTFGERSTEARIPTDRFMPDPDKLITGEDLEDGTYRYSFTNNSGYSLTVEFNGTTFTLSSNGGTAVKTSTNASEQIHFFGGSVILIKSEGKATFTDG
jgi:hypothetical protein